MHGGFDWRGIIGSDLKTMIESGNLVYFSLGKPYAFGQSSQMTMTKTTYHVLDLVQIFQQQRPFRVRGTDNLAHLGQILRGGLPSA